MTTYSERTDLYNKIAAAAILIHETEYRLRGDAYATPEDMECIRQDPLAYDDQIREMLTLATGYRTRHGAIEQASAHDMKEAARVVASAWAYTAEKVDRDEQRAADAAT